MAKDYIVFIHGVRTREKAVQPTYADTLFSLIQAAVQRQASNNFRYQLVKVPLYWGNEGIEAEYSLLRQYQRSSRKWKQFWFKKLRSSILLEFEGDIASYMSRRVGARVVDKLKDEIFKQLEPALLSPNEGDRLHLVAHSLGTVIVFDILFSTRWDRENTPGHDSVKAIRESIYGVEPSWMQGVRLASISTMGSPLGIFSLMDVNKNNDEQFDGKNDLANTHDITPRLHQFLERIPDRLGGESKKLSWLNFAHPGDPMASLLDPLIPNMVDKEERYVDVEDIILRNVTLVEHVSQIFNDSPLTLLYAGHAHSSYLRNKQVANRIAEVILASSKQLTISDR